MEGPALDRKVCEEADGGSPLAAWAADKEVYLKTMGERDAGYWRRWSSAIGVLDAETKRLYQIGDCRTFWRFPDFISL